MSTRGIFGVRIGGTDKFIYNHSDSYPSWLGVRILEATRQLMADWGLARLRNVAERLRLVDASTPPTEADQERLAPYTDLSVSKRSIADWYCLTRKLQGDLRGVLEVGLGYGAADFAHDSLFCEWGYIVNLDQGTLDVYRRGVLRSQCQLDDLPTKDDFLATVGQE